MKMLSTINPPEIADTEQVVVRPYVRGSKAAPSVPVGNRFYLPNTAKMDRRFLRSVRTITERDLVRVMDGPIMTPAELRQVLVTLVAMDSTMIMQQVPVMALAHSAFNRWRPDHWLRPGVLIDPNQSFIECVGAVSFRSVCAFEFTYW